MFEHEIGDDGAAALARGLTHNSTLAVLDLSSNRVTDVGCIAAALAENLSFSIQEQWCFFQRFVGTQQTKPVSADLNFVWASFAGVTQILKERKGSGVKLSNEVAGLFSLIFEIALS